MSTTPTVHAFYRAMKDGQDDRVRSLIASCAGAIPTDEDGCISSPLVNAAVIGRSDYVRWLLDAGADVEARNTSPKVSTFHLRAYEAALWFEHAEIVALLEAAGTSLDFGAHLFRRESVVVEQLLDADPARLRTRWIRPTFTLLHVAAELDSAELVEVFLERGVDPNEADADGHTPLRFAARNTPALAVVAALVRGGGDVNHRSRTGITPLTAACRHLESLPTVRWLLEHGADPNLVPANGTSALQKAVNNEVPEMVELLLAHGADAGHRDKKGRTALDVARAKRASAIVSLLGG